MKKRKPKYQWRQYFRTVAIAPESNIDLYNLIKQRIECSKHLLDFEVVRCFFAGKKYRRYKRGKNRCLICGVNLSAKA